MGRTLLSLIALTTISLGIILSEPPKNPSTRLSNKAPSQKIERKEIKKPDETKPISIVAYPYTPEKETHPIEEPEQKTSEGSKQLRYLFNESEFFRKETWELYTIERIETLTSNISHLIAEGKFLAVFKDVANGKKTILKEHKYPDQKITNSIEISEGGLEIIFTSEEREYALTLREGYFRANYNEENCNRQSAITFTGNSPVYFPEIENFPHRIWAFSARDPPREYFTLQDYESLRQFLITNFTNYWNKKINSPDAHNKP